MYHGENFRKMTQYGELGCIFWHNYVFKISHFLYKHTYIVSVESSSIVDRRLLIKAKLRKYIECLGGMFLRGNFLKSGTI